MPIWSIPRTCLRAHIDLLLSASATDLVDMGKEVSRVLVDADRPRLTQFVWAIAATQKADTQRPAASCGQHVPNAVSDNDCRLDGTAQPR